MEEEECNEKEEKGKDEKEERRMNETEQESEERKELRSINTSDRQSESMERSHEIAKYRKEASVNANAFETTGTNLAKLRNEIDNLKNKYSSKLTNRCHQLKLHCTREVDYEEVIRNFNESKIVQPVLDKIKLIEDQWRTLNLWEILQSVNPRPLMKFDRDELFEPDFTLLENKDDTIFSRSIVLCGIFENLMRTLGWKVGDTLDIEEDICDVVGQLLMKVEKQDRSSLLDCMQNAMMDIQAHGCEQDGDKLRKLLITKKKYNGLNLACILLEQMILGNKDNNVSWMKIVCAQFIDLVVQLIIEPKFRGDVNWTLIYLLKLDSQWNVLDVYNLIRNGLLMFHDNQQEFHRYLMIIRNFALYPSLSIIIPTKKKKFVELKDILYSHDEKKWKYIKWLGGKKQRNLLIRFSEN